MERAPWDLVGRDPERRRIAAAIASDRSVAVVGEAGIGKSSLVRVAAVASGIPTWTGGGFATLIGQPYLALGRAVGMALAGDATRVAATVERGVGPDLLVIDDLQWVDPASLEVIALLGGRVQLLTTIRTGDDRTDVALELAERIGSEIIAIGGLSALDARSIVTRLRSDLGAGGVESIVDRAGGNPLLLEEIAAHGEPSGVLTRIIEAGLDRLSADDRLVAELLAVADHPLEVERLGLDTDAVRDAGLVIAEDGSVVIRHALLAEAIRARLDDPTRAARHERLADLLTDPLERAGHLAAAGRTDQAVMVARTALPVTTEPMRRALLLAVVAEASEPADAVIPRLEAARALAALSQWEAVIRLLEPIEAGVPGELLVERAALLTHATYELGRHEQARAALAATGELAFDPSGAPAAHLALERAALMVNVDGDLTGALTLLDDEIARRPPASPAAMSLEVIRASIAMLAAQPVDLDLLRAAVDRAIAAGAYSSAADLARVVHYALVIWSGAEPALDFIDTTSARFEAAGVSGVALELAAERVQAAILAGRPADAVGYADEILERPAPQRARQTAAIHGARAAGIRGHLDGARATLMALSDSVTDDFLGRGTWAWAMGELELWAGSPERAIESMHVATAIPSPIVNAYVLPAVTRAWARLELDLPQEPPLEIAPTRVSAGAVPELAGIASLAGGDPAGAADRFAEGSALWSGYDALRALTCRWAEGEALRLAGQGAAMTATLEGALADATAREFEIVAVRIRRSMRQAGLRPASEPAGGTRAGLRLTARERDLLDLAGRGLTNIEIARRMGLGRPTVARILSNAMSKLGADSRAQAVAMVASD